MMNKLRTMLVFAVVGLGATSLFAHDRAVLLPQPSAIASGKAWTGDNLDAAPTGMSEIGATPVSRVVVSGYHPLQGFETETAAEQASLANPQVSDAAPKATPIR